MPSSPGNGRAVGQYQLLALGQPVDEVERRVAEGVGERIPQRNTAAELDEQVGDAAAREAAAEDAGEERHRHERECDEEEVVQRLGGILGDRADHELNEQDCHHERAGAEDGAERSAEGALGADEAGDDDRENDDHEPEREQAEDAGDEVVRRLAVRDGDRARTVRAVGVGVLVDQELSDRGDEYQDVRGHHQPQVPPALEPPGRVREQELHERPEREAVHDHAEREDPVVVRLGQRAEKPEV